MTGLLLCLPADRERWLKLRQEGIGASEIAAVMGLSPWESPFSLYWRKVNGWTVDASEEMSAGTRLEPVIADWWADSCDPLENLEVATAGMYAHRDRPWQLATPDRLLYAVCPECNGGGRVYAYGLWHACERCEDGPPSRALAVLECKYVAHSWDGWGEQGTDDIPVYYRTQVLWQCDVMDVEDWYLAVLGPGGFREYHGRRDEKDLAVMREYGRRFMARLDAGDPPDVDEHTTTIATLKRLHPALVDEEAEVPAEVAALYRRAVALKRAAGRLHDSAEAKLRAVMGDAHRATHGGSRIATRVVTDVDERTQTVAAHRRDYLLPPREKRTTA